MEFSSLNAMQETMLATYRGEDNVLLISPTGTGKTLAFLLPVLERLNSDDDFIQCVIIVPSRELGLQIERVFKSMKSSFKVSVCYGGHEMRVERNNLLEPPAVLIGTPGRLVDHIQRGNIDLRKTRMLVLDEFDKSLEFGFEREMIGIIDKMPALKKRILVSATQALKVPAFAGMGDPVRLDYTNEQTPPQLKLKVVRARMDDKFEVVVNLLGKLGRGPTLVFCNHKDAVRRISELLRFRQIYHEVYHGDLDQDKRERALIKFRNGSANILLTTDLASRGLDIPEIRYVVHYQLPQNEEAFIHRNGRTARMHASGTAYLLLTETEPLPKYLKRMPEEEVVGEFGLPEPPTRETMYISGGKKDKIRKVDIVGWILQNSHLEKDDLGNIDIKDFGSYIALRKGKAKDLLPLLSEQKIKKRKVKVQMVR